MRIHEHMMLDELAVRMGSDATDRQAAYMRIVLIREGYLGCDTADVPDADWDVMIHEAATGWGEATQQ